MLLFKLIKESLLDLADFIDIPYNHTAKLTIIYERHKLMQNYAYLCDSLLHKQILYHHEKF